MAINRRVQAHGDGQTAQNAQIRPMATMQWLAWAENSPYPAVQHDMRPHLAPTETASGSLLGWLGFKSGRAEMPAKVSTAPDPAKSAPNLLRQARSQLLEAVSLFLLDNDLAVTPDNLLAAHSAFSGANPHRARQIAPRVKGGEPITQEWLDEVTGHVTADTREKAINPLLVKLEENLDAFAHSTRAARTAT